MNPVYSPTYIASFQHFIGSLKVGNYQNERFKDQLPTEIIKTLEAERNSNEPQFFKHLFQLDETIDQYSIYVLERNESVEFVWYCWDEHNCNSEHELNQIYSAKIPTAELTSWLVKLTAELKRRLANKTYE